MLFYTVQNISSVSQLAEQNSFTTMSTSITGILSLVIVSCLTVVSLYVLLLPEDILQDRRCKKLIGILYSDIDLSSRWSRFSPYLFIMRRLNYCLVAYNF